jgi:hypothetical protein
MADNFVDLPAQVEGPEGPQGPAGEAGSAGPGVPSGGTSNQVLIKQSATDYDTAWTSATTAIISDSADKRYVTDAQKAVLENTSGTNTGDETNFTTSVNSSSPNATIPVVSLAVTNAATDVDLVLSPKGNGGFAMQVADGTTAGGNKRGTNAVDFQMATRTLVTQVASGANSFLGGGRRCTASAQDSSSFGFANQSTGAASISGGNGTVASGTNGVSFGLSGTASGNNSAAFNSLGTADGIASFVSGDAARAFSIYGRRVHASGAQAAIGDTQSSILVLRQATTNATVSTLTCGATGQNAATTTNQLVLQNNNAMSVTGRIVGKQTASTNCASWKFEALIVRGTSAATTSLVASSVTVFSNSPGWGTPALSADTTNGCLKITVTGLAATSIRWACIVESVEVIYA